MKPQAVHNSVSSTFQEFLPCVNIIMMAIWLTGIAGWVFDVAALINVLPNAATMKFNTVLGFLFASTSLWYSKNAEWILSISRQRRFPAESVEQ